MKINGSDEIIKNSFAEKTIRREQDQNDDFKNILKASVERSAHHPGKIESPPLANPVSAIRFHPLSPENKRITIKRLDNLLNLLDNCLKYASEGLEITVELEHQSGRWVVRVGDRGPGIPAVHRGRVFETFHRVDDSLTAEQPGSGLGLSIARQLARDLGGDLTCRERDGGGTWFELTVPEQEKQR